MSEVAQLPPKPLQVKIHVPFGLDDLRHQALVTMVEKKLLNVTDEAKHYEEVANFSWEGHDKTVVANGITIECHMALGSPLLSNMIHELAKQVRNISKAHIYYSIGDKGYVQAVQ